MPPAAAGFLGVGTPVPAAASCVEAATPASLLRQDGDVVVGVAEEVRGHRARLAVEEVWSGPDRAPLLWVVTGSTSRGGGSSSDVVLSAGERYVVALRGAGAGDCSVVQVGGERGDAQVAPA